MARPKNQQARRAHVIDAARRAIVSHGLAAVRVRDIADAAGLAPGSITYYFRELGDLFHEVYSDAVQRFCAQRWEAIESVADPAERLGRTIASGLPVGADDDLCRLLYEFSPQAMRSRVDAALRETLYDRQVALYHSILETGAAAGAFTLTSGADDIAHNLVALEDSYGYHIIARTSVTRELAEELILGYAEVAVGAPLTRHA